MAFTEAGAIKEKYNSLINTLKADGHTVEAHGGKELPLWKFGRTPPKVKFQMRQHEDLSEGYEHGTKRAEEVARLIEQIDSHYRDRLFRKAGLEIARNNLTQILNEMRNPEHIIKDMQLVWAQKKVPEAVAERFKILKRQLVQVARHQVRLEGQLAPFRLDRPVDKQGTSAGRMQRFYKTKIN